MSNSSSLSSPSPKKQRSGGGVPAGAKFAFARDCDATAGAEEHPCFILTYTEEKDDDDHVWVQWASNGSVRIPKRNVSQLDRKRNRKTAEAANDMVKRKRSKLSLSRKQRENWRVGFGDAATSRVSLSPAPTQPSATSAARPDIVVIDLNDDDDANTATATATASNHVTVGQARRTQSKPCSSASSSKDNNINSMNIPTSSETGNSVKSSHRSSAYVQHIAEACTLIMKDGRWQTYKPDTASRPLFQWESGDDLSAVRSFMSMHSEDESDESHGLSEVDEVFERAIHLYSRMYHRKGPWFDLADLYIRYYAPPKEVVEGDETKSEFSSVDDAVSSPQEQCNNTNVEHEERGSNTSFFAPKPCQRTPARRSIDGKNLAKHQSSLTLFFQDLLRLFSLGLVRTFASEQECGAVAGKGGRRGLLSAEERREVLSSLGAKKSKSARKSLPSRGSTSAAATFPLRNEILQQMRSQQTLSFSSGGHGRLLPVIKHVNRVLMRKMATKVAVSILPPRGGGFRDTPRKAEVDSVAKAIQLAWESAALGNAGKAAAPATLRLREAPLKSLRRVLRLFYIAGGGPGAMRGDGSNCWLSVIDRGLTDDPRWQTVNYPGLVNRLGLECYEMKEHYHRSREASPTIFASREEFEAWECGVELRAFFDRAMELIELERIARRRKERDLAEQLDDKDDEDAIINVEESASSSLAILDFEANVLLTVEGRERLAKCLIRICFGRDWSGFKVESIVTTAVLEIEDVLSALSNDRDADGFTSDTERILVAGAVVVHSLLKIRLRHPRRSSLALVQSPWLRHLSFDAQLVYMLWDVVPTFERRAHYGVAVDMLQTILFGQRLCEVDGGSLSINMRQLEELRIEPFILCLLPRRNRGKAYERLLIDLVHLERQMKKTSKIKDKKPNKRKSADSLTDGGTNDQLTPLCALGTALLRHAEATSTIPYCSLRNLARRVKETNIPQSCERMTLQIRQGAVDEANGWSPTTDTSVANSLKGDSDPGKGKRCAFVSHEDTDEIMQDTLNVEELAMEEYFHGRLPAEPEGNGPKGGWVGWHNEGGHVRGLFRILLFGRILSRPHDHCPHDRDRVFLTPYQRSPHDLHVGHSTVVRGFYDRRRAEVESFLSALSKMTDSSISDMVYECVKGRWEAHPDDRSRLKDRRLLNDARELRTLSMVAAALGGEALARIFRALSYDYRVWSGGLPDLLLVRARCQGSGENVELGEWVGEGFSKDKVDERNAQRQLRLLFGGDDEFLGCSKNSDSTLKPFSSNRTRQRGVQAAELPAFPAKLEFTVGGKRIRAESLFVEVKSHNDRLSERQEDWLSILGDDKARVCKFTHSSSKSKSKKKSRASDGSSE